ncbi:MAG TPA: NADH-quinone oxidoreductase subunit C [Candidatus Nitrosotenuis sp.]|jgi:NADH-quinone oxidoreductase subunit C|nr:NADH-quinone oxidoreductase subunit C [Candidatus Nitrosotenuis sp.]
MKRDDFLARLKGKFPQADLAPDPLNPEAVRVPSDLLPQALAFLKDDPDCGMHYLEYISAVDWPPTHITLVYSLWSWEKAHRVVLKTDLPRDDPNIPTVSHLWANADWLEREIYDLFGVWFHGHPDPRRIMMPEDWEGHPLRKDYVHPNLAVRPD